MHARALDAPEALIDGVRHKGCQHFLRGWRSLVAVLNGRWWLPKCEHFCSGADCCPDAGSTAAKIAEASKVALFTRKPQVPSLNKWTKIGPCVDVLVAGIAVHGLFVAAFAELQTKIPDKVGGSGQGTDAGAEPEYDADVEYSAVQGKRFAASL